MWHWLNQYFGTIFLGGNDLVTGMGPQVIPFPRFWEQKLTPEKNMLGLPSNSSLFLIR